MSSKLQTPGLILETLVAIRRRLLTMVTVGDQVSVVVVVHTLDDVFQDPLVGIFAYPALQD